MSTANSLILASLAKIGKNSPLKPAKPDDIAMGFDSLTSFFEQLRTQNIILSTTPVESVDDEVGESLDTRNALINLLAVEIAANYDNGQIIVSETLQRNAENGMAFLKKWYNQEAPPFRVISSTAPRGAGNERYRGYSRRFFGPFRVLEEPEAVPDQKTQDALNNK